MWTTTRTDMLQRNWIPNHFVAVLPVSNQNTTNIPVEMQRWRLTRLRKIEKDRREKEDREQTPKKIKTEIIIIKNPPTMDLVRDSEEKRKDYSNDSGSKSSHQMEYRASQKEI